MEHKPLVIRRPLEAEASLIADISRQTFVESFGGVNTEENMNKFMTKEFSKEKLMAELSDNKNSFFMALSGEEIAGYVKLRESENPSALKNKNAIELSRIYAVNKMIGMGVGKLLMEKAVEFALETQKEVLWLGVWEKNERAINFYHRWGFVKFSEHNFILGDDVQTDWLMKKALK